MPNGKKIQIIFQNGQNDQRDSHSGNVQLKKHCAFPWILSIGFGTALCLLFTFIYST